MRRQLAWVFVALAVMLAVGFLVPLGISVRSQAESRGLASAQSDARGVATAIAAVAGSTGEVPGETEVKFILDTFGSSNLIVILPNGLKLGEIPPDIKALPLTDAGSIVADVDGGAVALVPVSFVDTSSPMVVGSYISDSKLREGVTTSWLILTALGLIVVIGSVPLADRFASSLIRPVRELSDAAHQWAEGDLSARVSPSGPSEISESGQAFNLLAERLTHLLAAERERVADLSHRLRTPLAALRLQAESINNENQKTALISDISNLEGEVTALIEDVRRSDEEQPSISNLTSVVSHRMGFWQVVAAAQDRPLKIELPEKENIIVASPDAEILTALDNLVQNVLTHTPVGTQFSVKITSEPPSLIVSDEGEGLSSPDVFDRGASTRESSGLGLDIVRKIAEASGGDVRIGEGKGTTIVVRFGIPTKE
jgi:signal transduction histidine kinase